MHHRLRYLHETPQLAGSPCTPPREFGHDLVAAYVCCHRALDLWKRCADRSLLFPVNDGRRLLQRAGWCSFPPPRHAFARCSRRTAFVAVAGY